MKWGEQARVLRLIPGLEQAEFVRFGMVHRNTYINGPTVLRETWQTRTPRRPVLRRADLRRRGLRRVGGVRTDRRAERRGAGARREPPVAAADDRDRRARLLRVARQPAHYQPTNITFGIMPPLASAPGVECRKRRERKIAYAERALAALETWMRGRTSSPPLAALRDDCRLMVETTRRVPRAPRAQRECVGPHGARLRERPLPVPDVPGAPPRHAARPSWSPRLRPRAHPRLPRRLHKRGNSRSSAARKLSAIRAFGRHLRREGELESDPAALVGTPRQDHHLPAHLGEAECRACSRCRTRRGRWAAAIGRSSSCSMRRGCA